MDKKEKIVIIGAGVSGLIAAWELEKKGFSPRIIEATDRVGGRVKTDYENNFQFDHGFQVLLTAYPEVARYLNVTALNLKRLKPGAIIFDSEKPFMITDPLRAPLSIFSAIFSPVGTLSDKWKMWRLTSKLKGTSIEDIFTGAQNSTMEYLIGLGFSDTIIKNFFQPFFSGIFLEKELNTPASMFKFIFKMFAEGHAAVPEKGMQAIPDQLKTKLKRTDFTFNTKVKSINNGIISTDNDDYNYDKVIITIPPSDFLIDAPAQTAYQSTINLYFSAPEMRKDAFIGLCPAGNGFINNICVLSDVASSYGARGKALLSVSVIGTQDVSEEELTNEVKNELMSLLKLDQESTVFLRSYYITNALPKIAEPSMELSESQCRYDDNIYLAGDYLLGGSLNAAMASGRQCVDTLLQDMG